MENITVIEQICQGVLQEYLGYRYQIDGYIFFSPNRLIPEIT